MIIERHFQVDKNIYLNFDCDKIMLDFITKKNLKKLILNESDRQSQTYVLWIFITKLKILMICMTRENSLKVLNLLSMNLKFETHTNFGDKNVTEF